MQEPRGTVSTNVGGVVSTLVTSGIGARKTGFINSILNCIPATGTLALPSGQVEVLIRRIALPGHHVKDGRLAPRKSICSMYIN